MLCKLPQYQGLQALKPTLCAGAVFFGSSASAIPPLAAESALAAPLLWRFSLATFLPSGVVLCASDASAYPHSSQPVSLPAVASLVHLQVQGGVHLQVQPGDPGLCTSDQGQRSKLKTYGVG